MADPTPAHRQAAADLRAMHQALTDEGFTDDQAVTLLCRLVTAPSDKPAQPDRRRVVEQLLAGQKPPATRSPANDRAADLWNPPAPTEGAPAHE